MEAILNAAEELLASEGIEQVTLRQIADRAGVQHGLITRHFGTKQELLREVIERGVRNALAELKAHPGALEGTVAILRYFEQHPAPIRVTTQAALNGVPPKVAMSRFPNIAELLRRLEEDEGLDLQTAKINAAVTNSLLLGVVLMRPWLLATTAIEGEAEEAAFDVAVVKALDALMHLPD